MTVVVLSLHFSYTVSITVNKQVPYQTRYHVFCWSLTFRCSRYKTELRNEIATEVRDWRCVVVMVTEMISGDISGEEEAEVGAGVL